MKNLYVLLLSLACSTAVLAQTDAEFTTGEGIIEEVLSEGIFADENLYAEMTDENSLSEEIIDFNSIPEDVLAQIQQDCSVLAQSEGVEQDFVAEFVEVCVLDSITADQAIAQDDEGTEMLAEEYAEVQVEDDFIEEAAAE